MGRKFFRKNRARGFTLVEVLISAAILAFTICAILATYISCFVLIATSKNINIATNAAFGLIEEMRATPFTQIIDDYNGLKFTLNDIPESMGIVYVDDANPELLEVTVSVCWQQGLRVIGEDANLNGILDYGEDVNNNNIIDSTVQLVTRIANR